MRRHLHSYDAGTAIFSAPNPNLTRFRQSPFEAQGISSRMMVEVMEIRRDEQNSAIYGITTVTQRCTGCGELRSYTTPGQARLIDKAIGLVQDQ